MDERFSHHWTTWHEHTAAGETPADFLRQCSDETLVELLAYAQEGTPLERNIISTELTNRISRLHRAIGAHSVFEHEQRAVNKRALADVAAQALVDADSAERDSANETDAFQRTSSHTSRYRQGRKREGGW